MAEAFETSREAVEINSDDAPNLPLGTSRVISVASFAKEVRFKEFARVELWDGKRSNSKFWFRVSDHKAWHHCLRATFNGTTSLWENSGSSSVEGH